jgi:hypothetical protein
VIGVRWIIKTLGPLYANCERNCSVIFAESDTCRRPLKGHVHLRNDLRFDLRFGSCVIHANARECVVGARHWAPSISCVGCNDAKGCIKGMSCRSFLPFFLFTMRLTNARGCVIVCYSEKDRGPATHSLALSRQHGHRIAGQITGRIAGNNASGHVP